MAIEDVLLLAIYAVWIVDGSEVFWKYGKAALTAIRERSFQRGAALSAGISLTAFGNVLTRAFWMLWWIFFALNLDDWAGILKDQKWFIIIVSAIVAVGYNFHKFAPRFDGPAKAWVPVFAAPLLQWIGFAAAIYLISNL